MDVSTGTTAAKAKPADDPSYAPFLAGIESAFQERSTAATAVFTVDTLGLWDAYLSAFPDSERQTYVCHACKRFVEQFGGLVTIGTDGQRVSAVWHGGDGMFAGVCEAMRKAVERLPVTALLVAPAGVLGTPLTGEWTHIHVTLPKRLARTNRLLTAHQIASAVRENVATVERFLDEFPLTAVEEALRVLEADAMSRAEKFVGPVRWLRDLHTARAATKDDRKRSAAVWHAVATSPEGYSHPRASVIGPLIEGIVAGKSFETLREEFAAMLHPLRYQRPTAAPAAGNIAEAERIVAELGLEPSLERRFARLEECETLWLPTVPKERVAAGGVFSHLQPKAETVDSLRLPTQTMTWEKFARTVLPTAETIALNVPSVGPFIALTAGTNADAPPIIRWDREDKRNSTSWYVYHNGSQAAQWGLSTGWRAVTGIVPLPNLWGDRPTPQHGEGYVIVLQGMADTRNTGLALFPEHVRDDLRAVRSTIEAFSARGRLTGQEDASACGFDLRKGGSLGCLLRVTIKGKSAEYRIDRWD